jgi:hypothetical protein
LQTFLQSLQIFGHEITEILLELCSLHAEYQRLCKASSVKRPHQNPIAAESTSPA